MRKSLFFCFFVFLGFPLVGQQHSTKDSFTVYLFLLEDCKITQAYTDKIQELYHGFSNDSVGFWGGFPNPISEDSTVRSFVSKYQIPFFCTRDGAYTLAQRFGVKVTPEVVVYNQTRDSVLYQGRIDNMFERVGQRRKVITSHELEAALYCIQNNKPVPIPKTNAIGCFLN